MTYFFTIPVKIQIMKSGSSSDGIRKAVINRLDSSSNVAKILILVFASLYLGKTMIIPDHCIDRTIHQPVVEYVVLVVVPRGSGAVYLFCGVVNDLRAATRPLIFLFVLCHYVGHEEHRHQ